MNNGYIAKLREVADGEAGITKELALNVLNASPAEVPDIFAIANRLKQKKFGNKVFLCSIVNAKSGSCSEDCAFCAQSAHHKTSVDTYKLMGKEKIQENYKNAANNPIDHFGIVTSGEGLNDRDVDSVCDSIKSGTVSGTDWCASLGILTDEEIDKLVKAGLKRFHHNIETAESFFKNICTTHPYESRIDMVRRAKNAGLEVCCGGLLGIGESLEQRVELAFTLRSEKIDSIPLNFHVPVAGTKLEHIETMKPLEILKAIAMFRIVNPDSEIKVAAGRIHLRDLQSMVFYAGASGIMIGDLLTIAGRDVKTDLQMLEDLQVEVLED